MSARHRPGFTLIELLLAITIIAVLAGIVIVAINPGKQMAQARNTQRLSNIRTVLEALSQYSLEHDGSFQDPSYASIADCAIPLAPAPPRKLCLPTVGGLACDFGAPGDGDGCIYTGNLTPRFVVDVPSDPQDIIGGNDDVQLDYTVLTTSDGGHLSVFAPNTEIPETTTMSVTR